MNRSEDVRASPMSWRLVGFLPAWKSIEHVMRWKEFEGMDAKQVKRRIYHEVSVHQKPFNTLNTHLMFKMAIQYTLWVISLSIAGCDVAIRLAQLPVSLHVNNARQAGVLCCLSVTENPGCWTPPDSLHAVHEAYSLGPSQVLRGRGDLPGRFRCEAQGSRSARWLHM